MYLDRFMVYDGSISYFMVFWGGGFVGFDEVLWSIINLDRSMAYGGSKSY